MLGRFHVLAALSGLLAFAANATCDASMDARPDTLPEYVLNGQDCLANLPDGYAFDEAYEAAIEERINAERTERGLPELAIRIELRDAARWHSLDMAANKFFAHMGLDKRMPATRISAFDRTLLTSVQRENIAAVTGAFEWDSVVDRLHDGLMDSPSHKEAMLAEDVTHVAIGVVKTGNGVWLTELFVRQDGTFESPVPLSIAAGTLVTQPATLEDWAWSGLALRKDGKINDLKTPGGPKGRIPKDAEGVYALTVRGEQPGPTENSCRYIHFSGPRVEIVQGEKTAS